VIVVADGCTDGSDRLAEEAGAVVERVPEAGGPARARNTGARMAEGSVLFFVDADVTVRPDALARVQGALGVESQPAAVFGSYDDAPAESNFLSQYKNLLHHHVHQHGREDASTFWAACGAVRSEAFKEVGGFDERYRKPSIEDIELGYRLRAVGHGIRLCKTLKVKHLKRWTGRSLLASDLLCRAIPWTRLILHHRGFVNDLNTDSSGRASVALAYVLCGGAVLGTVWPAGLVVAGAAAASLLVLNGALYRFYARHRGVSFAVRGIVLHTLYHLYCGVGFATGAALYLLDRLRGHGGVPTTRSRSPKPNGDCEETL